MKIEKLIVKNKNKGKPMLAVLIDPDKFNSEVVLAANGVAQFIFVGGSELKNGQLKKCISNIKKISKLPVVVFPGDNNQLDARANAMLLLGLISGNNSEYIVGKHIEVAKKIKAMNQEIISTAYIMVDGGRQSATQRVTSTKPIKSLEINNVVSTAIAAELIGYKLVYLEAGSGAKKSISEKIITNVKNNISLPLIVGGGIDSLEKARLAVSAGADMIVIGNALEKNISLLNELKKFF